MPRRDKTGPNGQGANTGRGLGNCSRNLCNQNRSRNLNRRGLGGRGIQRARRAI